MSLSNILVPNQYDLYSNSLTMNLLQSQPVVGNNTLWLNSSNNHLYRDGVDLEGLSPTFSTFVPVFTPQELTPNTYTNIASSYMRSGNMVIVWSCYSVFVNSANDPMSADISVPVPSGSNLTNSIVYSPSLAVLSDGTETSDNFLLNLNASNTNSTIRLQTQAGLNFHDTHRISINYSYQI